MIKYRVALTEEEREELQKLSRKGTHRSQKVVNALILLNVDGNHPKKSTNEKISEFLNISMKKIDRVKKRFVEESLEVALHGRPQVREYERKIDGDLEAKIIALCCSQPPEGFCRWSFRLLADKVVELEYVDSISYETIRRSLKKTNYSLGKR